ncbi:MAG: hypothetical protein GC206_13395 [Alphaproteobacteria bacterium]|nr:hypothetical protein [Alphaproteobacteria bacterium]
MDLAARALLVKACRLEIKKRRGGFIATALRAARAQERARERNAWANQDEARTRRIRRGRPLRSDRQRLSSTQAQRDANLAATRPVSFGAQHRDTPANRRRFDREHRARVTAEEYEETSILARLQRRQSEAGMTRRQRHASRRNRPYRPVTRRERSWLLRRNAQLSEPGDTYRSRRDYND